MFEAIGRWVLGHRALTWAGLALLFAWALLGATRLQVDFSARAFFGSNDPATAALDEFLASWGADDAEMLVLVEASDGTVLTPERLAALAALADHLADDPDVGAVTSVGDLRWIRAPEPGNLEISTLAESMPDASTGALEAWRAQVLSDPLLVPGLLSSDGRYAAMIVEFDVDSDRIHLILPIVHRLRKVIDEAQGIAGLRLHDGGIPAARASVFGLVIRDQLTLVPLAIVVLALLAFWMFRSLHGVTVPLLAAQAPLILLVGLMGWVGEPFGIINQVYSVLVPIIAIADAIHLVSRYHEEARKRAGADGKLSPAQRDASIVAALGAIGGACFFTTATTVVGFLSLLAADMQILKAFGAYAAFGLISAYLMVLVLIPLLLSYSSRLGESYAGADSWADRALATCARLSVERPAVVLVTVVLVAGLSGYGAQFVVIDNMLTGSLPEQDRSRVANRLADEHLGGAITLQVDLRGEPGTFKEPEILAALAAFGDEVEQDPQVRAVRSPAELVERVHSLLRGEPGLPSSRQAVARTLLLVEGEEALLRVMDLDAARARVIVQTVDPGGIGFAALSDRVAEVAGRRLDALPLTWQLSGTAHVAYRGINNVTNDLRDSLLWAFAVIGVLLGILFMSGRLLALSFVPNALPLLVGYGMLGWMGWTLDPLPAVLFTVALAIAVDDTIHLLARYREELAAGRPEREAISIAVQRTGRAVGITSIMLMAGFLITTTASFPGNVVFGWLGFVAIGVALLGDLFVLPALLVVTAPRSKVQRAGSHG